jgi:RAV-like factor
MDSMSCLLEDAISGTPTSKKAPAEEPLQCVGSGASVTMDVAKPGTKADSGSMGRATAGGLGGKLPSSRYRSMVPQPNRWWGAQI